MFDVFSTFRCRIIFGLFLLMGVSWMWEIISFVAGGNADHWLITDVLNILTGVFIFFTFVCKPKVWELLKLNYPRLEALDPWCPAFLKIRGGKNESNNDEPQTAVSSIKSKSTSTACWTLIIPSTLKNTLTHLHNATCITAITGKLQYVNLGVYCSFLLILVCKWVNDAWANGQIDGKFRHAIYCQIERRKKSLTVSTTISNFVCIWPIDTTQIIFKNLQGYVKFIH